MAEVEAAMYCLLEVGAAVKHRPAVVAATHRGVEEVAAAKRPQAVVPFPVPGLYR